MAWKLIQTPPRAEYSVVQVFKNGEVVGSFTIRNEDDESKRLWNAIDSLLGCVNESETKSRIN